MESIGKNKDFDEAAHVYYLNKKPVISVTQIIDAYKPDFPRDMLANKLANGNGKWSDFTSEEIKHLWNLKADARRGIGNATHAYLESQFMMRGYIEPSHEYERAAEALYRWMETKFDIISAEEKSISDRYRVGYTTDVKLISKNTGKKYIGDYKTNSYYTPDQYKRIKGGKAKSLGGSFPNLLDLGCDTVKIQTALYKKLYNDDHFNGREEFTDCISFHINPMFYKAGFKVYLWTEEQKAIDIIVADILSKKDTKSDSPMRNNRFSKLAHNI